jgi:hypothetical protein
MPACLARSFSMQKWKSRTNIRDGQIPADGLSADLGTADNGLSFWLCDPTIVSSIDDIALALASTRDRVQRLDLVWLDEEQVRRMNIRIDTCSGNTPVKELKNQHRECNGIDPRRFVCLARAIAGATSNNNTKRYTERQILDMLAKGVQNNLLSLSELKGTVAEKIKAWIS